MTAAAKDYISGQNTTLLTLPALSSLNNLARVKITDADTGDTANSLQSAGYLPQSFVNLNSYGQSYALFVKREDAGAPGVADAGDRLIGLLVTTGGSAISDQMGVKIAGSMGAPGGFLYADSNPADPSAATTARGIAGGWEVDLTSTGWSSIGSVAKAGRIATLVNLIPSGMGVGGGGGGGASDIDGLDDGLTDYGNGNMFIGQDAGDAITSGTFNNGIGLNALQLLTIGSRNTAVGTNALDVISQGTDNVGIGYDVMANLSASAHPAANTAIGMQALWYVGSTAQNTAIGYQAMLYSYTNVGNVAVGYRSLMGTSSVGADTASYNTAIGHSTLAAVSSGNSNTAIGYQVGSTTLTTGTNNILIGTSNAVDVPAAASSSWLNIGNTIYGDLSTDAVNIGSATLTTGIGLDVGSNTSASRLSVGTTAQRPACTASLEGAQRWNSQTQNPEFCTGGQWIQPTPAWTSISGTPPTPSSGSGYFVLTASSYTGNLGSLAAANANCLSDLTANDWMGKATAISLGLLTASKVKAWLCIGWPCNNLTPLTTYYFAASGAPTVGGANFSTDSSGRGPGNNYSWAAANYFSGTYEYWTGARGLYSQTYANTYGWSGDINYHCNNLSSTAVTGYYGTSSSTSSTRYEAGVQSCANSLHLICYVNP